MDTAVKAIRVTLVTTAVIGLWWLSVAHPTIALAIIVIGYWTLLAREGKR